jgi:predicted small lipoprotein YifL
MMLRLVLIVGLSVSIAACGTKSPLDRPDGQKTNKTERNPSEPPNPIAR